MKLFCLLSAIFVYASHTVALPEYTFKRLTTSQGLSNSYIVDLAQDNDGCVWIATESGLNRFDGNRFTVFNTYNSGILSNELNTLYADTVRRQVWIGTQRKGISVIDCRTQQFTSYTTENGLITNDVTDVSPAADGGVWITHYHVGLEHLNPETGVFTRYEAHEIPGMKLPSWCAVDDGQGHVYVGHKDGGMSIIDLKTRKARNFMHHAGDDSSLPGNDVHCIFIDDMHNVWVGTNDGLALFNEQTSRFITFRSTGGDIPSLRGNPINDIKQSANGTLWVCTQLGGVYTFSLRDNVFTAPDNIPFGHIGLTNDLHGLSTLNARCLLQDKFGNIWIGNYQGGIDFLSYTKPTFHTLEYTVLKDGKLVQKPVWGIAVTPSGSVWAGCENELVEFRDEQRVRCVPLSSPNTAYTHASCIYRDSKGILWLGMYKGGIQTFDPQTGQLRAVETDDDHCEIYAFREDREGRIWVATQRGISSLHDGKIVKEEALNALLPDEVVRDIAFDKEGHLWAGTFGKGLVKLSLDAKLLVCLSDSCGLPTNAVNCLYVDTQGGLWVGLRKGLGYIDNTAQPQLLLYNDAQGLYDLNIRSIVADRDENIWISTYSGISQWDRKRHAFYNYTQHEAIANSDFMERSACIDHQGALYFGSQNGTYYFNPADITHSQRDIPVFITDINSYDKPDDLNEDEVRIPFSDDELRLDYRHNSFYILFNVIDYTLAGQVEYEYNMKGISDTWYRTDNENRVNFRDLAPGEYTFRVRARLHNQEWGKQITTIRIVITPPFWLSWYAKLLYALLICGAVYAFLRFYMRKLTLENRLELERQRHENDTELNNERLRFYTNITHELRTPLTLILGPLEDLLADRSLSPKHANKVSIIHDSATRLLNLINQILEFRKTETQNRKLCVEYADMGKLMQELGLRYKELNQKQRVRIDVEIETQETKLYFDPEIMTIIVDNLMSNAIKYTDEGNITLRLTAETKGTNRYTVVQISDTGYGISAKALPHIFQRYYQEGGEHQASGSGIGLALVKSLVDLHQATIGVVSHENEGSTFTMQLLTDNTYPNAQHKERERQPEVEKVEGKEKPILLAVEDNEDIRKYIRSSFEDEYEVLSASNGQEGWELAQARIPNIVVTDIMMPVMDGIALCRLIKEDMRTSHIPVILLTAKDTLADKEEGYRAGADSFITKPFSARLLSRRIENLLENRRKIAALIVQSTTPAHEAEVIEGVGGQTDAEKSLSKLDMLFLSKVNAIITENISMEKMDVAFIADKMCMSHSTLYRKIKGLTNMSVNEFVRKLKMKCSLELLNSGEYSIGEIADMTGFSSVSYFRQCFKDEYGTAPSEYVKKQK